MPPNRAAVHSAPAGRTHAEVGQATDPFHPSPDPNHDAALGPGAYDPPALDHHGSRLGPDGNMGQGHSSAFRNTGHKPPPLNPTGPPGSYDLVKTWAPEKSTQDPASGSTAKAQAKYPVYQMKKALNTASMLQNESTIVGYNTKYLNEAQEKAPGPGAAYQDNHYVCHYMETHRLV